jgi:CARDB protein
MPFQDRRAAGRRRAWGRGPIILKLESLERRALMAGTVTANSTLPDLANSALTVSSNVSDWNGTVEVEGRVTNQGNSTETVPFQIALYASPVRGINKYSVPIGEVTIPAGLAPGQTVPYQTSVQIPSTPVPDVSSSGGTLYIAAWVNPTESAPESNYRNDRDIGPPHDAAPILIEAPTPANLVGTTLAVTPIDPTWGSTITVTAQITNQSSGSSPQTEAVLSLTPNGLNYGDATTIGIGTITVPPLSGYQTVNLVQNVTLPAVEPVAITNYTNFGLTMTQDGNYATNDLYPNQPTQGVGYDQTPITITTSTTSTATTGSLPDLAASSVVAPTGTVTWGQNIQVSTVVQNVGQGDAGSFQVFFLLTGQAGSINDAIYLGQTTVSSLASGANDPITQSLTLPTRLPSGVTLNNVGYARIAVIVDPDNFINESIRSNAQTISAPFIVRLPGSATTVPTTNAAGTLPTVAQVAQQQENTLKAERSAKWAAAVRAKRAAEPAKAAKPTKKLRRKPAPNTNSVVDKTVSLAEEVTKLPHQVISVLEKSV